MTPLKTSSVKTEPETDDDKTTIDAVNNDDTNEQNVKIATSRTVSAPAPENAYAVKIAAPDIAVTAVIPAISEVNNDKNIHKRVYGSAWKKSELPRLFKNENVLNANAGAPINTNIRYGHVR